MGPSEPSDPRGNPPHGTHQVNSDSFDDPAKIAIQSRLREAIDGYATALVPLIGESYGPESMQQAWREFMPGKRAQFTGDHLHSELFFSWFFHCWSPSRKKGHRLVDPSLFGIPPTQAFLSRHSSGLNSLLRRYLATCLDTPFGFYQINACRPETGFRAWDLLAGTQVEVFDRIASSSLQTGEIIFARVPLLDGIRVMDAIGPVSLPASFHGHFVRPQLDSTLRKHSDRGLRKLYFDLLRLQLRARLPEIRDGSGKVLDGPATYLSGGASAYPSEVILGPEEKRDGTP
jgi:hypothetical protein